ncbi:MAG TPA: YceI family protein [Chitinophagaceae bacterium]|nr:YceI family protein [Chitinophagaceae bacterium]
MRIYFLLFFLVSVLPSLHAQYKTIQSLRVQFQIKNAGIKVDGSFSKASAVVSVDPRNILNSTFTGTVQVASVHTGNTERDAHLRDKEEFFNVKKFPIITFKSLSVKKSSFKDSYKVEWLLTMKGISKKVSTDVLIAPTQGSVLLVCVFNLNRLDWKVGNPSLTLSNDVMITLNCTVTP